MPLDANQLNYAPLDAEMLSALPKRFDGAARAPIASDPGRGN
jgi:hypothetical protein